jgi:hypothetical protein
VGRGAGARVSASAPRPGLGGVGALVVPLFSRALVWERCLGLAVDGRRCSAIDPRRQVPGSARGGIECPLAPGAPPASLSFSGFAAQCRQRPGGVRSFPSYGSPLSAHPHPRPSRAHWPHRPRPAAPLAPLSPRCLRRAVPPAPAAGRRDGDSPRSRSAAGVGGRQGTEGKRSWGRLVANRWSAVAVAAGAWGVGRLIHLCGVFLSPPPPGGTCAGLRAVGHAIVSALRGSTRAAGPRARARRTCHLGGDFFAARARARTTARAQLCHRARFRSMPRRAAPPTRRGRRAQRGERRSPALKGPAPLYQP